MKNVLTISILLLLSIVGWGQTIVTKTGTCFINEAGVDYDKAVEIALERAKVFAVSEVCGEDVSVFTLSRTGAEKTSFTTRYSVNTYGVVHVLNKFVEHDGKMVSVTMTGKVYRVLVPRAIEVSGFDDVYDLNENLTFNVTFTKKSFLKIFWFDEENGDGGILYNGRVCFDEKEGPVKFPLEKIEDYKTSICPGLRTQRDKALELFANGVVRSYAQDNRADKHVTLLFVTTAHNMPFKDEEKVTEESFMDWWWDLPTTEREMPEKRTITIKMM